MNGRRIALLTLWSMGLAVLAYLGASYMLGETLPLWSAAVVGIANAYVLATFVIRD